MAKELTIGLVVPFSTDKVPDEGPMMYPGVNFILRRERAHAGGL